jgi:hypothetical protein
VLGPANYPALVDPFLGNSFAPNYFALSSQWIRLGKKLLVLPQKNSEMNTRSRYAVFDELKNTFPRKVEMLQSTTLAMNFNQHY